MTSNVPVSVDFDYCRGDAVSWTLLVTFPSSAPSTDLNTCQLSLTAKNSYDDADSAAVFQLTKIGNAAGQITIDPSNTARAFISLSTEATEDLATPAPLYKAQLVFDVELIDSLSRPYTLVRGTMQVYADVTRNL